MFSLALTAGPVAEVAGYGEVSLTVVIRPPPLADKAVSEQGVACSAAKLPHQKATTTLFRAAVGLASLEILPRHDNPEGGRDGTQCHDTSWIRWVTLPSINCGSAVQLLANDEQGN